MIDAVVIIGYLFLVLLVGSLLKISKKPAPSPVQGEGETL